MCNTYAFRCYQSCKDKNFKAIHNETCVLKFSSYVVINLAKIKILKQFTTSIWFSSLLICCYQSCKDKNFKAIHNHSIPQRKHLAVVINLAKIKILKQFTTIMNWLTSCLRCYQSCKDKNFKAIHNKKQHGLQQQTVVINLAKIKILKQFTTVFVTDCIVCRCYQSCKDKNFKAIHNFFRHCCCHRALLSILQR